MRPEYPQRARRPMLERYWEKVDRRGPDECWPWVGGKSEGYGRFMTVSVAGTGDLVFAHQFAYYLTTGEWPAPGQDVRHSCHNRDCVNGRHLSVGSRLQNMQDMVDAGRSLVGELQPNHKLTWAAVMVARQSHRAGVSAASLARTWGVSERTMRQCLAGETWRAA